MTQEEFAYRYNCTKGNVSGWERGRHEPTYATLRDMAEKSGVHLPSSAKQDFFGEALIVREVPQTGTDGGLEVKNSTKGKIPVVGTAQLGDNGHFCDLDHPVGFGDGNVRWPTDDANAYALRCRGESMKPRIRHGEYVVVEPNHEVVPGDEVVVRAHDGRVMVKQLAFIRDGMVHLDSVNESHPRISLLQSEIAVLHYVAGIAKNSLWTDD